MSSPPRASATVQAAERAHQGIQNIALGGGLLLCVALVVHFWSQRPVAALIAGVALSELAINLGLLEWLARRHNRKVAEWLRMFVNAAGISALGYATRWNVLSWALVPYMLLWFLGLADGDRLRMILFLVLINTVAMWTGSPVELAVAFTLITLPVELDASRRAREMLMRNGLVSTQEAAGVSAMLNAAALTYVAAAASAVSQLLYFIFLLFGGRRN